jgi:hypothetical protein
LWDEWYDILKENNDFEGHTWFMQGGMPSNMIEVEHQRFALELV